jgi:hypothetical protein
MTEPIMFSFKKLLGVRSNHHPCRPLSRPSSARLGMEILEERTVPDANLAMTGISLVDMNGQPLTLARSTDIGFTA